MKCSCCGKRKGIFESYECISNKDEELNVCVKCAKLLYIIREASAEGDVEKYEKTKAELLKRGKKKMSTSFKKWFQEFSAPMSDEKDHASSQNSENQSNL